MGTVPIEGVRIIRSVSTSEFEWAINNAINKEKERGFVLIDVKTHSTSREVITKSAYGEEYAFETEYIATLLFTKRTAITAVSKSTVAARHVRTEIVAVNE